MSESALPALQQQYQAELAEYYSDLLEKQLVELADVASLSDFFLRTIKQYSREFQALIEAGELEKLYQLSDYQRYFSQQSEGELDLLLRQLRQVHMARIIFRDLTRRATMLETVEDLSCMADFSVEVALNHVYAANVEKYGVPTGARSGKPQRMTVLALGKLGACELNLSSDIDLIFFYDEQGEVQGRRSLTNQEFFLRVSRELIALISNTTANGFVFRVDMRLRPYGDSGSLILHRSAMEKYYLEQGRDWERYALIKARVIAGDRESGADFLRWLTPFIYRRHLDFGAVESLRDMKRMINREVARNNLADDVKLGPGGIREIEFIAQAHQLIFAGTQKHLRESRLIPTLKILRDESLLPAADVEQLLSAYEFLRNSEHIIQAENDRQTQKLPDSPLSRERMAKAMQYDHWMSYLEALEGHRQAVSECFARVVTDSDEDREDLLEGNLHWQKIWQNLESSMAGELLAATSFQQPDRIIAHLRVLEQELDRSESQEIARERFDRLIPVLLSLCASEADPDTTLNRVVPILEAVVRRSTYVSFLLENLDALKRLVNLCAMSSFVASRLAEHPILLYALTDRETQAVEFDRKSLKEELDAQFREVDAGDLEVQMDLLRQFKHASTIKVAVYELLDLLPLMKASDALTDVAELILEKAISLSWNHFVARHGRPNRDDGTPCDPGFAVLAYGKLGGIELSYGSDLDLVFIHDGNIHADTDGAKPVNTNTFFMRLGQRIIHMLSSMTRFGVLYEVDPRLRPAGNKGPLVSTISAFERYQREDAWTWEHQALVRARFVAGDRSLGQRIEMARREILSRKRDREALAREVISMREKMREHLDPGAKRSMVSEDREVADDVLSSGFDLKHGAGAIVDIEFMVQYAVLGWACKYQKLTDWSDKMRLLDELASTDLFSKEEVRLLQEAYLAYRRVVHYEWLGGQTATYEQLNQYRQDVMNIWNHLFATANRGKQKSH